MSDPLSPTSQDESTLAPTKVTTSYVPRPSRMDLLGRRDASRWGGLSDLELEQREKAEEKERKRKERLESRQVAPPLEGGNEAVGSVLQQQLIQLQAALAAHDLLDHAKAKKLLSATHTYLLGAVGLPPPKPPVPREGDPPLPPPPPPVLAIDHSIMVTAVGSAKELSPELLIQAAEVAAKLGEWAIVWQCLSLFTSTNPPLSQYLLRGLVVQALAQAELSQGKKGEFFTQQIQEGIKLVLRAVKLITENAAVTLPIYNFILYNAAAIFLVIARPLLRHGFRHHTAEGFAVISAALEVSIPVDSLEKDVAFEVEFLRQATIVADEMGDEVTASKYLTKHWNLLCKRYTLAPLHVKHNYIRLWVHVHKSNPKAIESFTNDLDTLSRHAHASFAPGFRQLIALQKVKSGFYGHDSERIELELKELIEQLADANLDAVYEDSEGEVVPTKGRKKLGASSSIPEGRQSPAAGLSTSQKKKPRASAVALELNASPRDLAAAEVQRAKELEAQRAKDRLKKKQRSESYAQRMEVMSEAGWECWMRYYYDLAQKACNTAILIKRTGLYPAWILAELLSVVLDVRRDESNVFNLDGNHPLSDANSGKNGYAEFVRPVKLSANHNGENSNPHAVTSSSLIPNSKGIFTTRIHGLKILEQTLSSAVRLMKTNPELIEMLVREIWSLLLPLLQRNLTGQLPIVLKLLKTCSSLLGDAPNIGLKSVESPLLEIRVLMHYETALIEASHDYISKAMKEMEEAWRLDYTYASNPTQLKYINSYVPPYQSTHWHASTNNLIAADSSNLLSTYQTALSDHSSDSVVHTSLTPPERFALMESMFHQKEAPFLHLLRPYDFDRFQPFLHRLQIQSIMYDEPIWFQDSKEDQAWRWISQAKEMKLGTTLVSGSQGAALAQNPHYTSQLMGHQKNHMKKNLVMKAIQLLDKKLCEELNSSSSIIVHEVATLPSELATKLSHTTMLELETFSLEIRFKRQICWSEILHQSWEQGFDTLIFVAVQHLLELTRHQTDASTNSLATVYDQSRHSSLLLAQVEALILQMRACLWEIQSRGFEPGLIRPPTILPQKSSVEEESVAAASKPTTKSSDDASTASGSNKKKRSGKDKEKQAADEKKAAEDAAAAAAATAANNQSATEITTDSTGVDQETAGLTPDELKSRTAALFYEQLLHASISQACHILTTQLTDPRYAYLTWNIATVFHNAFQKLWYAILGEPVDSSIVWLYSHTPAELAGGKTDTKTVLLKVWDQLLTLIKSHQSNARTASTVIRKPALLLQFATILARIYEKSSTPFEALPIIHTVLSLVHPQANPTVTHPLHPVYDPMKKKMLYEVWTRIMLTSGGGGGKTKAIKESNSSGTVERERKPSLGGHTSDSIPAVLASQTPEYQLFILLELLKSPQLTQEEKKSRLQEALTILTEYATSIKQKLNQSLASVNGDVDVQVIQDRSASRNGRSSSNKKRAESRESAGSRAGTAPDGQGRGGSRKKRGSEGGSADANELLPQNDSLDPSRRLNPITYHAYQLTLRELLTWFWTDLTVTAHDQFQDQQLLIIQTAYHGLQTCPGYDGPKLIGSEDLVQLSDTTARPGSSRSRSHKKHSRTKQSMDMREESKEEAKSSRSQSPRSGMTPRSGGRGRPSSSGGPPVSVQPIELPVEPLHQVSASRWCDYAHLSLVYGLSIVELISPIKHDQPSQDQIRRAGMDFFVRATQYAVKAIETHVQAVNTVESTPSLFLRATDSNFEVDAAAGIMLKAAKTFWNTSLPMTYEKMTRKLLIEPLGKVLENLEKTIAVLGNEHKKNDGASSGASGSSTKTNVDVLTLMDPEFRCSLYTLYFDALKDGEEWQLGYASSSAALKTLPAQQRKVIWSNRILFMSKLGLDVGVGILKMKDNSRISQAKIWLNLARQFDGRINLSQKYDFYLKAIDVMEEWMHHPQQERGGHGSPESTDPILLLVEVLCEFAEFLYTAGSSTTGGLGGGFTLADAQQQLHYALDLLAGYEQDVLEKETIIKDSILSASGEGTRTIAEQSIIGSKMLSKVSHSRGSPNRSGRRTPSMSGSRLNATGSLPISGSQTPSGFGLSASISGSVSGARTPMSGFSNTLHSGLESSVRGSHGSGSVSSEHELVYGRMTIKHLFLLLRIYSMLGTMSPTMKDKIQLALVTQYYTQRIWSQMMQAVEEGFFGRVPVTPPSSHGASPHDSAHASVVGGMTPSTSNLLTPSSIGGGRKPSGVGPLATPQVPPKPVAAPAAATTPYIALPKSQDEWLQFRLPQSIRAWLAEQAKLTTLHSNRGDISAKSSYSTHSRASSHGRSLSQSLGPDWSGHVLSQMNLSQQEAVILLHYLSTETLPVLKQQGFTLQLLPIYYLAELIVAPASDHGVILANRTYQSLIHLQLSQLMDELHQPTLKQFYLQAAEPIMPTPEESLVFKNQVEKREQLHKVERKLNEEKANEQTDDALYGSGGITTKFNQLQIGSGSRPDSPTRNSRPLSARTNTTVQSTTMSSLYTDGALDTHETILASMQAYKPAELEIIGPSVNIRKVWLEMIDILLNSGRMTLVKQLLNTWLIRFSKAWSDDLLTTSKIEHVLSRIALSEGALTQALSLEKFAQSIYFGKVEQWTQGIVQLVNIYEKLIYNVATPLVQKQAHTTRVKHILGHSLNTFIKLLHTSSYRSSIPNLKRGIAQILQRYVAFLEQQYRYTYQGFGQELNHHSAWLPIPLASAISVAVPSLDGIGGGVAPTGDSSITRPDTSFSVGGSELSFGGKNRRSSTASIQAFTERTCLQNEQQKLQEEIWSIYEKIEKIYLVVDENDEAEKARIPTDELLQPLEDPAALCDTFLAHAFSLIRYTTLFAYPCAEHFIKSAKGVLSNTANQALVATMLAKVTQGLQALHQALLLLNRADRILSAQLLVVNSSHLNSEISLPLQRKLQLVKSTMAGVYLQLVRFKRPRRHYDNPATIEEKKVEVLRLDSFKSDLPSERATVLSFAGSDSVYDAQEENAAIEAAEKAALHEQNMNSLFFEKYSATFSDPESESKALLNASEDHAYTERAVHLAASAVNLEGNFKHILHINIGGGSNGAAVAGVEQFQSFHPRLLQDNPVCWLRLGQALASLYQESLDQAETDALKQQTYEQQLADQKAWEAELQQREHDRLAAQAAREHAGRLQSMTEEEKMKQREADELAREQEEERVRLEEEAARAQLLAEEAARQQAEEEAAAAAAAPKSKKKKKPSKDLSMPNLNASSGEKHYQPELPSKSGSTKKGKGRGAKVDESLIPTDQPARPPFKDYSYDTSAWSPYYLQLHLEAGDYRAKMEAQLAAADEAEGGKKGKNKRPTPSSPASTSRSASPKGSTKKKGSTAEIETPTPAISLVDPTAPPLPTLPSITSLQGQSILILQKTIELCLKQDWSWRETMNILSKAALELVDLFGTQFPQETARYLNLYQSARLKLLTLDTLQYATPSTHSESLVLSRQADINQHNDLPGPELEMTRKFLKGYSEIWKMLSLFSAGYFEVPIVGGGDDDKDEATTQFKDGSMDSSDPTTSSAFSQYGVNAFNRMVAILPPSVTTVTLEYDPQTVTLYSCILNAPGTSIPLVSRTSLTKDASKEFTWLLHTYAILQSKIQRSTLVYGSLSNAHQLDNLERAYIQFLGKMNLFFNQQLFESLHSHPGLFKGRDVVLLISSPSLWSLPFESLTQFGEVKSLSRDFSLSLFTQRIQQQQQSLVPHINVHSVGYVVDCGAEDINTLTNPSVVGATAAGLVATAAATKAAAQQSQPSGTGSRPGSPAIATLSSSSHVAPAIPSRKLKGQVAKPVVTLETPDPLDGDLFLQNDMVRMLNEIRSIVLGGGVRSSPNSSNANGGKPDKESAKADKESLASLNALRSSSPGWLGLSGEHHQPVLGEWTKLLLSASAHSGAFLYCGYESFLARFTPTAWLNLPHLNSSTQSDHATQALLLFDRSVNDRSYRAQSKLDNMKTPLDKSLETTFFSSLFISLKGVSSILLRAHCSSGPANTATSKLILESLLLEGHSLGSAARVLHTSRLAWLKERLPTELESIVPIGISSSIDMVAYLDHAIWSTASSNNANQGSRSISPKRRASVAVGANQTPVTTAPRVVVRPLVPTYQRDLASTVDGTHPPGSPKSVTSPTNTNRSTLRHQKGSQRSVTSGAATAASVPDTAVTNRPTPPMEPSIKLRVYDQFNLLCVGLPFIQLQ